MINFGLEGYLGGGLYFLTVMAILYTLFKRPVAGLYVLIPVIPLQTIRYRLHGYPLGDSIVGVTLLAVAFGLLLKRQNVLVKNPWSTGILAFFSFTFVSLCLGSLYLRKPLPFMAFGDERFANWRDYILMPMLFFLVVAAVKDRKQILIILMLMFLGALALDKSYWSTVADRDFSEYSEDLRDPGAMGYAGVNGLAAFEAQFGAFALALFSYEKRRILRWVYGLLAVASGLCLMFSLSRGGYAALVVGCLFLAIVKMRRLLVGMVVFGMVWPVVVPHSVRERVEMTYDAKDGGLDHSSETRVGLWEDAMRVFDSNAVLGTGFNTYAYMGRVGDYKDTHNYFIKVLVETGVLGLALFLFMLLRFLWIGLLMHWKARDPMTKALGLGLAAWVVTCMVSNFFGDRWSFLQVNGYMWVIAGLAARALMIERAERVKKPAVEPVAEPVLEPAVSLA